MRAGLLHVGIEYPFLLQVMGHGVLGQERRLEPDFGANPFAFGMGRVWRMVAAATTAELGAEVRALNLIKLTDLAPGGIAHGAGNVDLKLQNRHKNQFTTEAQRRNC